MCSHVMLCAKAICTGTSAHVVSTLSTNCHPANVLRVACVSAQAKVMPCLTTFLQRGQDCFLIACEVGHQEIVRELLTRDEVDRNVVDEVRS